MASTVFIALELPKPRREPTFRQEPCYQRIESHWPSFWPSVRRALTGGFQAPVVVFGHRVLAYKRSNRSCQRSRANPGAL